MREWWQTSNLDDAAQQARQLDYYNTFYSKNAGRNVLLDLQRLCFAANKSPEARIALIELFNTIRSNCGANTADTERAAIDAEAGAIVLGE